MVADGPRLVSQRGYECTKEAIRADGVVGSVCRDRSVTDCRDPVPEWGRENGPGDAWTTVMVLGGPQKAWLGAHCSSHALFVVASLTHFSLIGPLVSRRSFDCSATDTKL